MRAMDGLLVIGAVAGAAAMPGCNQAFDLRPTEVIDGAVLAPPDIDKDGVLDETDNCAASANADQADSDTDGFGDACDACPALATKANHDEDGDFRGDDCDVCPSVPDFQLDSDGNGIGNACGTFSVPSPTRRVLFDSFVTIDESRWRGGATPWHARGDAVSPGSVLPSNDRGLELIAEPIRGTTWKITVGFASARPWVDGDRFGIWLVNPDDGTPFVSCTVLCTGTTCANELVTPTEREIPGVVATPITRIFLEVHHIAASNTDAFYCGLGTLNTATLTANMLPSAKLYVTAMPDIPATYIDLLE